MVEKNKETIRRLNKGFETGSEELVLSCIVDDIQWHVAGAFTANGREEFRKNIRNEGFTGDPTITTINEIGEGNQVAVEGEVKATLKDGTPWSAWFHNTYTLFDGRITKMTSYLVQKPSL